MSNILWIQSRVQSNNEKAFFALVRAGLWEQRVQLLPYGEINFAEVQRLAEEQSVVGLVAAGLERVVDVKVAKKDVLQFIGQTLQLEQKNQAMNYFIGILVDEMRDEGLNTILVKGQGIAQCYERPLWRSCGDVDFLLDNDNYAKAKSYLSPLASSIEVENKAEKHLGMTIDPWVVELHGTLHTDLSTRIDKVVDEVQDSVFYGGNVRSWLNGDTQVFLPSVDNDVIFIFTHYLKHFFKGGIGLRQICDWCRLLFKYKDSIDVNRLKSRIKALGLESEWHVFSAYSVDFLGMNPENIPFYKASPSLSRKAKRVNAFILETGNFGHNRDVTYYVKYPFLIRKTISLWRRTTDAIRYLFIFPVDSVSFYCRTLFKGFSLAAKGIG